MNTSPRGLRRACRRSGSLIMCPRTLLSRFLTQNFLSDACGLFFLGPIHLTRLVAKGASVLVRPELDTLPTALSFGGAKVSTEVRDYIQHLIMSGRLSAGDRLRVEHLAEHLKLSVTPVREALVELFADGFVERRVRRGYVVAKLTCSGFEDRILVLAMVAGELAARAADRMTPETIAQLRQLEAEISECESKGDRVGAERAAHRLHRLVNLTAESPELAWTAARFARYVPKYIGLEWKSDPRPAPISTARSSRHWQAAMLKLRARPCSST